MTSCEESYARHSRRAGFVEGDPAPAGDQGGQEKSVPPRVSVVLVRDRGGNVQGKQQSDADAEEVGEDEDPGDGEAEEEILHCGAGFPACRTWS